VLSGADADPLSGRELVAFVRAIEAGSVGGAAEALGLTQSAVSKRIQSLERRTGVTLVDRGRLGVRPTEAGRMLYPEARQALAALDQAAAALGALSDARAHLLRLAASHTIGEFLLPGWLAGFRTAIADPTLHLQLDIVNSRGVLSQVRDGAVEVGFVEGVDRLDDLEGLTLAHDELVVVVGPDHRWARRSAIRPRELAREGLAGRYYTRERDSGTRAVAAAALAHHGIELAPALETSSIQGLKRAVLAGGFTVLSSFAVAAETRAGTLRTVEVGGVGLERELLATRRRATGFPGAARLLWSWLREHVADH